MTYPGYMALANDSGETIELVNAARVQAYTDNLAPTMGLRGCEDCDGLEAAVGDPDGYTTPEGDNAPWFDPTDPATADFYGVYPLGFAGIDDSTRSIESAELTGDGSVVVGSRFTGKDIRVNGVAFAKDEAALSAGVSWLDNALNGTEEGRCFGDRLNVFASCPPVQVLPPNFADPYTLDVPVSQTELDSWTTTSGTITAWPGSGGTEPGLRFDWSPGDPQKIACREITGLIPNEQYQLRMRLENFGDYYVRIADTCSSQRINLAPNPRLLGWVFSGGGVADVEADVATGGPLGLGYRQAITTSSNASSPYSVLMTSDEYIPVTPGTLYQASIYVRGPVEITITRLSANFRDAGGGIVASDRRFQQNLAMDGTWQRMSGILVVPENAASMEIFVAWSAGVGIIQPNMEFGVANLLVEEPRYDILRTNVQSDPRALGPGTSSWNFSNGTGGVTTPTFITGAVDGPVLYGTTTSPTYKRHTVTTAPTGGNAGPFMNATKPLDLPDPITTGTEWVAGAWFRSNRTVSGVARFRVSNGAFVAIDEVSEPFTLNAGVWTYIAGGRAAIADLIDPAQLQVFLQVGGVGGGAAVQVGDIYDSTGGLGQVGSADEAYFDSLRPPFVPFAYIPVNLASGGEGAIQVEVDDPGTYFDGYTDGFKWDGTPGDSKSSVDQEIDYQTVSGWAGDPPTDPDVLDFIPRSDSVFLSITPTQTIPSQELDVLLIESALVRRIPRPGVLAFGSGHNVVPPSDGWTHLAPAGMSVQWIYGEDVEYAMVWTIGQAPSGSALTYLPEHGIERTVFGMIPGNRYRFMIEFESVWFETDASPGQDIDPFVSVGTGTGAVATYTEDTGTSTHYWTIEFTATQTSTVLGLHPNANLALGSYGSVWWQINQFLVEEILQTDATEPDPGRFQARTMYEVKASQGPIITNVRRSPCGVMAEITYSLRAGNPFKYRNPIFAGGLPTGTSVQVPDIPCSEDGLPQIINYAYNPSLETNAVDWLGGGTNITSARTDLFGARVGQYAFRVSATPGAGQVQQVSAYYNFSTVTSGPTPQPGEEITVSFYARVLQPEYVGVYPWEFFVATDGFDSITFDGAVDIAVAETWYRVQQTIVLPQNVTLMWIQSVLYTPASITTGGEIFMDGLMIQRGSVATDPFDETFAGAEWTGSPNTSAIALVPSPEDLTEDPDCPTPPLPPAPPVVDDSCVTEPISYSRTVVAVSADTVPRSLTAYPIITLTAGSGAVRQARIRFWENPENLTIDDLDPCAYEGEIIVSYLGPETTLVIDGVLREATISRAGIDEQNANHILYGPNGGPVEWPELTGGIPYLVTLELDSDEPYTDTLMLVDLVVRD